MQNKIPRYITISIDIATKIKKRELKEGIKLKGRSLAAAQYNVSAETMRKSFGLLADNEVIEVKEKSGAYVISRAKAIDFLHNYKENSRIDQEFNNVSNLMKQKKEMDALISKSMKSLQNLIKKQSGTLPFEYVSIQIHPDFVCCNKTIEEMKFFENSGSTLFGIVSQEKPLSFINPKYVLQDQDILYFTGEKENTDQILQYVKNTY